MVSVNKVCIACPVGCHLTITEQDGTFVVEGNQCNRGEQYGIKEMVNPERMLTTTVCIESDLLSRLPVKTVRPIPKESVLDAMKIIRKLHVKAPITIGDIVYENILNTGIDIIATRSVVK